LSESLHPEMNSLDNIFRTMIFDDPTLSPTSEPDRLAQLALGFAHDVLIANRLTPESQNSRNMPNLVNDFLASIPTRLHDHPEEALSATYDRYMNEDGYRLYSHREEYLVRRAETSRGSTPTVFSTQRYFFGKGSDTVAPGDRTAVLFGCRVPVVLRPYGDFYQLVGPCYLHGAMNGEVMQELDKIAGALEHDIILV
jgi:hypothetical protein